MKDTMEITMESLNSLLDEAKKEGIIIGRQKAYRGRRSKRVVTSKYENATGRSEIFAKIGMRVVTNSAAGKDGRVPQGRRGIVIDTEPRRRAWEKVLIRFDRPVQATKHREGLRAWVRDTDINEVETST